MSMELNCQCKKQIDSRHYLSIHGLLIVLSWFSFRLRIVEVSLMLNFRGVIGWLKNDNSMINVIFHVSGF